MEGGVQSESVTPEPRGHGSPEATPDTRYQVCVQPTDFAKVFRKTAPGLPP